MKKSNRKKILVSLVVLPIFFFGSFIPVVDGASGVPLIIGYQGRLTNGSGNLVGSSTGTTYYFKFSIWDVATGGSAGTNRLWPAAGPTSFAAPVRQGVFTVNIGDTGDGYPDTLNYNFNTNKNVYLQIEVSSDNASFETLSPRQRISSTPFAQLSGVVSGTGTSSFGTTTPIGHSVITIEATSTSATPLFIRGIVGQVAKLFRIQSSTGAHLFSINSSGGMFASSTLVVGPSTTSFIVNSSGDVGVGTALPARKLNVLNANSVPQLRLSQTASVYGESYVNSAGDVIFSSTGGNIRNQDENLWVCSGGSCGVTTPVTKGNLIVETAVIFNNKFKLKQIDASTTIMYDTIDNIILQFDEGQ